MSSNKEQKKFEDFFKINQTATSGRCLICFKDIKMSQRSRKGLRTHLLSIHSIKLDVAPAKSSAASRSEAEFQAESEAMKEMPPSKKLKIDQYFLPEDSMPRKVSRMVSKDGFTFQVFTSSEDLRHLFNKSGHDLPKSSNTVRNIVVNYSKSVKAGMIIEIKGIGDQKFSLTFDEWTSRKNRRYLNVNLHCKKKHYNLGMIRIHGSCTAETCVSLLKDRLKSFNLDFEKDIVGMTTDGAKVMQKVGKLMSCYQQLCYAHGIQLAINDVLYKRLVLQENLSSDDDQSDDEIEDDDSAMTVRFNPEVAELIPDYAGTIKNVRAVVKIFKNSPVKNDTFLQKYVQEEFGKKLELVLDCKTRWSSLYNMLERFIKLRPCISKALIDVNSALHFSEDEWSKLIELKLCLEPMKLGVEAICRQDATLITAETTLRFIMKKLNEQSSLISKQLVAALHERVIEHRNVEITGTVLYLQNPKNLNCEACDTFKLPKKSTIRMTIKDLLERISPELMENSKAEADSCDETQPEDPGKNFSLQQELESELQRNNVEVSPSEFTPDNLEKAIKKEMLTFESSGSKGKYLSLAYENLLTIRPTSVEAERAFSAAGYLCSELRTRLNDETIDVLCFLRSHFQNETKSSKQ